jgi:hypothetical protein
MADEHRDGTDGRPEDRWRMNRRRVLQAAGVGIGGLSLAGFSGEIATAKTGCARGPFERTYEPGTINVGQIRAEQARGEVPSPDVGAASPRSGAADPESELAPRQAAQESNVDQEGPLTVRTEYDGVNSLETRGGVPSDSQVAAGDGQLVHALNRNVAIYNKQSGRREQFFRLERLWEPVIPEPEGGFAFGLPFVFDPRARYDRGADRFILCATQYEPGLTTDGEIIGREDLEEAVQEGDSTAESVSRPPRGWFLVAVSATSNPNGEWHVYRVPPEDAEGLDNRGLVDYPTLGFDRDAIYLTQNFFGVTKFEVTMVTLDKAAMYAGETVTAHHFDQMSDPEAGGLTFTVHPAQQPYSGGSDGTFYLANSDYPVPFPGPTGTLTLWELTDPVSDPSLECFTLDADPYVYPPAARQPGTDSLVDTLGTRLMNVDYNDGSVWAAHSTAVDWNGDGTPVAAIRWYEIDVASRNVVQSGTYGEPNTSYFMPTVGSHDDATVIVHNVSGPETYPRMDVAGRTADYTAGELEDGIVIESGKSKYVALPNEVYGPVERWGDYNGVSVDPQSGRFWTVSQYSPDRDIPESDPQRDPYFTRIAEVYFGDDSGDAPPNGGG